MFLIIINLDCYSSATPKSRLRKRYRFLQRCQREKTDEQKLINEAQAYRNDIIPKARGQAEKMIQNQRHIKKKLFQKQKVKLKDLFRFITPIKIQRMLLEKEFI